MANRVGLLAATAVLAIGMVACGGSEETSPSGETDSDSVSALAQAQSGVEAAGYDVRPAEEADLITYLDKGSIDAEDGFVVTGKGQTIETFVLVYADQADTDAALAAKKKEGVFSVGEQNGLVYLAPDERTLNGIMEASA